MLQISTTAMIVSAREMTCLVGGGTVQCSDILEISRLSARIVAVDGGADHVVNAGLTPAAIIGDMDSISEHTSATFGHLMRRVADQDTTDFEKALTHTDATCILALGFTGGRMDHVLATLNVLARYRDRVVILIDRTDVSLMLPRAGLTLVLPDDTRIALMPLSDAQVTATGLRWPLADFAMHPAGAVSSSNAVAQGPVRIDGSGAVLVTVPRAHLGAVLKAALRG